MDAKKRIKIPLSGKEVEKLMGGKTKIITYKDLKDYDTIEEVLEPYGNVIMLYESMMGVGHWVLIFINKDGNIEVFDPYGVKPDDQLNWINDDFREESGQLLPHLTHLMLKTPKEVEYNNYQFQKYDPNVNTCGRHSIMRYLLKDFNIDEYKQIMDMYKNPDLLVSKIVY
jgi:hypothetical protein